MKIVQFITRMDSLDSEQIHVFELSRGLIKRGHDVIIISSGHSLLTGEFKKISIPHYQLKNDTAGNYPLNDYKIFLEIRKILGRFQPDILAIHSSKACMIGKMVAGNLKIPTISTAHNWSFTSVKNPIRRNLHIGFERLMSNNYSGIIFVSYHDEAQAKKYSIATQSKKRVIHYGIGDSPILSFPQKNDIVHLVMIARFVNPKNHLLLLEALTYLPHLRWRLTLVGEGPLLKKVQNRANELDVFDRITFLGKQKAVSTILAEADIFLHITKSDELPMDIIKAMRARLAIIASNVGGVQELIAHDKTGFLISKKHVNELIAAIQLLITNDAKRKKLAYAARATYESQFSFEEMLDQTEAFYEDILHHHPIQKK